MALILNLPIFVQNGGHCVCYHRNGGLAEKVQYIFTQTHCIAWADKIALISITKIIPSTCSLTEATHYGDDA